MSSIFNSNGNGQASNKNGEVLPSTKSGGVSSRELTDTIARLEEMREQVQEFEASEAKLQNQLTGVQELIAQKQLDLDGLEEKAEELRLSQAALEQRLFATAG